jgi:hypothetical protein
MAEKFTLENIRAVAETAGLNLGDDELRRLVSSVNRSKQQVAELREWITTEDEPAGIFTLSCRDSK